LKEGKREKELKNLILNEGKVTILFATKEESYNHARVLEELLQGENE